MGHLCGFFESQSFSRSEVIDLVGEDKSYSISHLWDGNSSKRIVDQIHSNLIGRKNQRTN